MNWIDVVDRTERVVSSNAGYDTKRKENVNLFGNEIESDLEPPEQQYNMGDHRKHVCIRINFTRPR